MPGTVSHHRDLKRIVVASVLVAALVVGGIVGVVAFAAAAIDRYELRKEQALVQRRLDRTLEGLVEDLTSATIWDDAVTATGEGWDAEWQQLNFGDYYADYMHHTATLVYDDSGRLRGASRDSEPVPLAQEAALAAAVAPMVGDVRAESMRPAKRKGFGFDAVVKRTGLVQAGSEIYLVAASTVVPDTGDVARPRRDAVVVTTRTLPSFLEALPKDLAIKAPRLVPATDATPASIPIQATGARVTSAVRAPGDAVLSRLAWTPERPGRRLLMDAAPLLGVVVLLLIAAGVTLFHTMDKVSRRLALNQTALSEARDRAEAANEAKTRFLANMSHELRTPLNGVMGMAEVLDAGELSPIQRSHLAVLKASGADLLKLIEQLLQVTRLEKGDVRIAAAPFNVREMLEGAVADHAARAAERGLLLSSDVHIEGHRIGDAAHLRQVVDHLLDNALIYTPHGSVRVEAECEGDTVHIRVIDTGPGIPLEMLECLFDPFVQVDDSSTRQNDGAGLGLSICRDLVKAMGGHVGVQTSARGSIFAVTVPLPPSGAGNRENHRLAA